MITTKQRAELKGMASLIQPAFQIGKGGVNVHRKGSRRGDR